MNTLLQIKDNTTGDFHIINVTQYNIEYDKIYGSQDKNMEGSTRSTLIGILPTIKASTMPLYQAGAKLVGGLLNQGYIMVRYYDSLSGTTQEEPYTSGDISFNMIRENGKWYEEVSFILTPVDVQGVIS
jgi:hypothetical protein